MHKGLIIDFNSVAAYLAAEDAKVQGAFFNTFSKELKAQCGTHHHTEMQLFYIQKELSTEAAEAIETLSTKPE